MILDEPLDDWMIEKLNSRLKVWKVSWRPRRNKMEAMWNTSTIAFIQQSWKEKKAGGGAQIHFLVFFFRCEFFATKAPYPKYPPSVKHWAGCHGFQCLPAILCSEDPVGQTPQAPKWKRPVMPAPPISIAEIHHAAKIHKVYGIYGWNIWAVKDLTAFALPFATLHLQWAALCSCKFASNCQSYKHISGSISKNHLFVNHAGLTMELRKEYKKNYAEQD